MIVSRKNFSEVILHLLDKVLLSLDTETTGLHPYHGSKLFSIALADERRTYYFNFNEYPELPSDLLLNRKDLLFLDHLFSQKEKLWFIHNAKFDMKMLSREGFSLEGTVHDTLAVQRLLNSELMPQDFSLDKVATSYGYKKDDTVLKYILENKLYTEEKIATGKKRNLHFQLVPLELISRYAEKDARICYDIGIAQMKALALEGQNKAQKGPEAVYLNELLLTKTVFAMEDTGVKVDAKFCNDATVFCQRKIAEACGAFKDLTGEDFIDSKTVFRQIFKEESLEFGEATATGQVNPRFDSEALFKFKHPAAKEVLKYRKAKSDFNFFNGFIKNLDSNEILHTNLNQHGAHTGRFTSSNPNLQNLTSADDQKEDTYAVRRAIVPRAPGQVFHLLDYDQMEYRLMLEYAAFFSKSPGGVLSLIEQVRGGLDVHQATANLVGISRKQAKTLNFALLYGSGDQALADSLKMPLAGAQEIRRQIFEKIPEIEIFIWSVKQRARNSGYIFNWMGRIYFFPDASKVYRAPNYLIQGGCADIVKKAMTEIFLALKKYKTKLVLSIHDELILEGPKEESSEVIPLVKELMENAYPSKHLKMTVGIEHSLKSLADTVNGICPAL
jgi:DNA polymerase-1